jgi:hypothetical protein
VSTQKLQRTTFETSRGAEYFSAGELTKQTGQPARRFGDVVVKELADNALDAAETAGVAPEVELTALVDGGLLRFSISDNGSGIPPKDVQRILNFNTRTSDKAAYRSPTRGAQGNALKTVIGIPRALGCDEPVVLEALGARNIIKSVVDPTGRVKLSHVVDDSDIHTGTKVTGSLPCGEITLDPSYWARAFSLYNPHAFVKLEWFEEGSEHGEEDCAHCVQVYKPTNPHLNKYKPTDPTSPHWYDVEALGRLIGAHIGQTLDGGEDLPLGEFVRQFRGLKSTAKAKAVCGHLGRIKHLSDFVQDGQLDRPGVHSLLEAMKRETEPPSHKVLGRIGKAHFRTRFEEFYGIRLRHGEPRFGYKHVNGYLSNGLPYTFEFAVAETKDLDTNALFYGVNYSPTFGDPLEDMRFEGPEYWAVGVKQFLLEGYAHPRWVTRDVPGPRRPTAVAAHVITSAPLFMDRGKTRLDLVGEAG